MRILAIESSCDETAAAVVEDGRRVLSSVIYSQMEEHRQFGGVVPEVASRRHTEQVCAVVNAALEQAGSDFAGLDAVAVTAAPGLIGALLVGVSYGKGLALRLDLPLIPVHHITGHIAANYLTYPELEPPFLCLVASGGHSHILYGEDYTRFWVLGRTRDDAAGEAFDKAGRAMGFPYPAGAAMDRAAGEALGRKEKYPLPWPKVEDAPLDMSFSGLKTAVLNLLHNAEQKGEAMDVPALAASLQETVAKALVTRTELAVSQVLEGILPDASSSLYGDRYAFLPAAQGQSVSGDIFPVLPKGKALPIAAAGGVCANSSLRRHLTEMCDRRGWKLYLPPLSLCGDNAAMIGAQAYYNWQADIVADMTLNAQSR